MNDLALADSRDGAEFMEILGYQLAIVLSLVAASFFGSRALLIVALVWTVETFALVFFAPLIMFQLAVVWLTYWTISLRVDTLVGKSTGASSMKAAADYDRGVRLAVAILMKQATRIQNTKREAYGRGPEYVAKYNDLYDKLLTKLPKEERECLDRQNSALTSSPLPSLKLASPHQTESVQSACANLLAAHDRFLEESRAGLSADPELRDIFVELTEQLKLPNLRQMVMSVPS